MPTALEERGCLFVIASPVHLGLYCASCVISCIPSEPSRGWPDELSSGVF